MSPSEPSQEDSGLEPMSSADAEQQTVTSASHELSGKVRKSPSVGKLQTSPADKMGHLNGFVGFPGGPVSNESACWKLFV